MTTFLTSNEALVGQDLRVRVSDLCTQSMGYAMRGMIDRLETLCE